MRRNQEFRGASIVRSRLPCQKPAIAFYSRLNHEAVTDTLDAHWTEMSYKELSPQGLDQSDGVLANVVCNCRQGHCEVARWQPSWSNSVLS